MCHYHISAIISLSPTYPLLLLLLLSSCFVLFSIDFPIFRRFAHVLHIFLFQSYFLCYLLYFWGHGVLMVAFCLCCWHFSCYSFMVTIHDVMIKHHLLYCILWLAGHVPVSIIKPMYDVDIGTLNILFNALPWIFSISFISSLSIFPHA